jgi:hypothetical protein
MSGQDRAQLPGDGPDGRRSPVDGDHPAGLDPRLAQVFEGRG